MTDQTAVRLLLRRRRALLLPLLLAACVTELPPQNFPPLSYDYLTKLKLNVATIDIDDSWTPAADSGLHVESMSPVEPLEALLHMARDRLITGGNAGQARFVVDDASIVRTPDGYHGRFAVHLDLTNADGVNNGHTEAQVAAVRALGDDTSPEAARVALYEMVKRMMDEMNVEFEYQIRHSLGDSLQTTSPGVPPPPPVELQNLGPPAPPGAAAPPASSAPLTPPAPPPSAPPPTAPAPLTPPAPPVTP
jgi:hypothetical protein